MVRALITLLLFGVAAVLALPSPGQQERRLSVQKSENGKIDLPDWIPWPPSHPEWIPWPPSQWFPEERPTWWPQGWEWPPSHPEWIPWPPSHPEWIPWPPSHPEWIPWPPSHPEWIPWPPAHPDVIPWPPTHPEWIPWPPSQWFPEDRPSWWPEGWEWPPSHPEWIPWPPSHPEWIPWPPSHPEWLPTEAENWPYQPKRDNQFHLFTRSNPFISQPLIYENSILLSFTNYDPSKKTTILVHGVQQSATSPSNAIMVPALLAAGDVNVIVVDWSGGASSDFGLASVYSVFSGNFIAQFVRWLSEQSGADLKNFHLVGYGIGGLNVGFIGRLLEGKVGYVTALDPSQGRVITALLPKLSPEVSQYTEVIHTNFDDAAYSGNLGHVDFFPNGGKYMPGCGANDECNSMRSVFYFAESLTGGKFVGVKCENYEQAVHGQCSGRDTLALGGLEPKTGSSGVYFLQTNANPPFAQG